MLVQFNEIGVVSNLDTSHDNLNQGSVGNKLYVEFPENLSNTEYVAKLIYTRSDGSKIVNLLMTADAENPGKYSFQFDDVWFFAKAGITTFTVFLYGENNEILAQGQVQFNIAATDYLPDDEVPVTRAEYNHLLDLINQLDVTKQDKITAVCRVEYDASNDKTIADLSDHLTEIGLNNRLIHLALRGIANYNAIFLGYVNDVGDSTYSFEFERYSSTESASKDRFVGRQVGSTLLSTIFDRNGIYSKPYQLAESPANSISYSTSAPTADNTGGLKVVVLDEEPEDYYDGYLYIITESGE